MKKIIYLISIAFFFTIILSSCNDTTYATELKNEKILIKDFIKRQGITIIKTVPPDSTIWNKNEYYLTSDGLYINIVDPGTGTDTIETNDIVVPRYLQYTLEAEADTISNWTTIDANYPLDFNYNDENDENACTAFHEAISYMKRNGSIARLIVPSKIDFSTFWDPATPMGYYIKIKFQK
ncbi:MAG: DUF4827 family protein [Paludibacter sp.]|nr:DUF4827 family protein [Paludibacter sp.]